MDPLPFDDGHNPYAAPEASLKPERFTLEGFGESNLGDAPISGPNPLARIRLDAVREAWGLFTEQAGTWILVMLVYLVIRYGAIGLLGLIPRFFTSSVGRTSDPFVFLLLQVVLQFASYALQAYLVGGLFQTAVRQVRGLPIGVADLFGAGRTQTWHSMFLVRLIVGAATFGGAILFIVPGLFLSARLMFAQPLVADGRLSTFDALAMSWKATRGQWGIGMLFVVMMYFTSVFGAIGLGIGILVTLPVWPLSIAVLYRDFFLSHAVLPQSSPWIDEEPDVFEEL